jgi:hypothetical protein
MKYKLYSDMVICNLEYDYTTRLKDIMIAQGIRGRARLIRESGNVKTYRVDNSGLEFSITTVYTK